VLHHIQIDTEDFGFSFSVGNSAASPFVNLPALECILKLTTHLLLVIRVCSVINEFSICLNDMM
jgi:hypothetical protein